MLILLYVASGSLYFVLAANSYNEEEILQLTSANIRPRACYRLQWEQVVVGNSVMANYNSDRPKERGFWYDAIITRKDDNRKEIFGKLILG